jgi:hypothetical protein
MDNGHGNASLSLNAANCSSLLVTYQALHDIDSNIYFGPSKLYEMSFLDLAFRMILKKLHEQ